MVAANNRIEINDKERLANARAIKICLEYLQAEANQENLCFAAYCIGLAALALEDSISLAGSAELSTNGEDNVEG